MPGHGEPHPARGNQPAGAGRPTTMTPRRITLRTLLAVFVVATGLALAGAGPAYACSCRAGVPIGESLADSDGAFVGVYTGRDDPEFGPIVSSARSVVNHFQVERPVKGAIGETIDVAAAAGGASCGLELEAGARTGLLLRKDDAGGWASSLCSQVGAEDLLAFAPAPADAGSPSPGLDWGLVVFAGLLVLALPVAFVVGGWRRR